MSRIKEDTGYQVGLEAERKKWLDAIQKMMDNIDSDCDGEPSTIVAYRLGRVKALEELKSQMVQ